MKLWSTIIAISKAPTGCGYPDRKAITLMNITKWKEKSPLEVKYYCPEGLTLEGDETRGCKENGSWTGEAPSCINIADSSNESISSEGTDETMVSPNDATEEIEHRFNVYIITGIGTLAAVLLVVIGIILYQRKKKSETRPIHNIGPAEVTSFDSETLVSTEELYEEIILDRRDDFKFDDDGYVSTDEVKRNEGEYSCVNSDKIKKTLALPTLNEEHHSHSEDQNSFDMCNLPGASAPKEDHFVMVENDLYKCSDNSDTAESD
ncbi:hypothetical protein J437_LFUL015836 [Ladona fulva]|uniref:Sushi domain-containing protein n=1 Tax=Ladona fulva TaxID=123851 RepID=A0A8K0KJN1_LADFU|nr:hypothetical protein J437_LFUL015836 [Ladona fulva]